jgi:putative transposase
VPDEWRWKSRRVGLVDGFTVSMPDTPDNQEAYPQSASQQEGVGFPLLRGVVLLSLATAMVWGLAVGPCLGKETGETALLRELFGRFRPGDVMLADRYFCSYFMICLLKELRVDLVSRLHQRRTADFRRTRQRVPGDWGRATMSCSGCGRRGLSGWTKQRMSGCRPPSKSAKWKSP